MSIVRLHIVVEGQTEEGFVNRILKPELALRSVYVDAHRITTGRHRDNVNPNDVHVRRGGFVQYSHIAKDLTLWMKQDPAQDSWFTTMIDYFALPTDFSMVRDSAAQRSVHDRIEALERALGDDIRRRLGSRPVGGRFVPYIQMHEFEALLFSQPDAFTEAFPGNHALVASIAAIRTQFATPEHINDGPATAPSKRIISLAPGYQKVVAGLLIAERIGLGAMRTACPRFDAWLGRLFTLAEPAA